MDQEEEEKVWLKRLRQEKRVKWWGGEKDYVISEKP